MGGSDVYCRHGDTLAAYRLEKTLPPGVQLDAFMADGDSRMRIYHRHLSIRLRGDATIHLFPILSGLDRK